MKKYDVTIIGAGIVGLATAYQLLKKNPQLSVLILEKENDVAKHQTGNNSGVIHSGIYYKPGSLKAKNCRNGYKMLLEFCDENEIEYDICGKVIVAVDENEIDTLMRIYDRGIKNGLQNLKVLDEKELFQIEPHAKGVKAVFVPETGIIDYTAVSKKMLKLIKNFNAEVIFEEEVTKIIQNTGEITVVCRNNTYKSGFLVSCAGLYSDKIAKLTHPGLPIRIIPFRGEYYTIKKEKRNFINSLIYPVPDDRFPFLGVHFTRMIDGNVEVGPNAVLAFKREGYRKSDINLAELLETLTWPGFHKVIKKYWKTGIQEFYRSFSKKAFVKAIQRIAPEISLEDIEKGGAGVRAQACDIKGGLLDDFYFVEGERVLHVCNAPSPAATASLSIGNYISKKILSAIS